MTETKDLAKRGTGEINFSANGEDVRLTINDVRNFLVSGRADKVSDKEIVTFMQICKFQHLNPWLKDCYLIKYSDSAPASMVVGKEAYMKRAQAQPDYDHFKAGVIVLRDGEAKEIEGAFKLPKDQLLGGWAEVYRKGIAEPTKSRVLISEYSTGQSQWKTRPATMIRKVAIVQALRETYPDQLGSLYIEEEQGRRMETVSQQKPPKQEAPNMAVKQTLPDAEIIEEAPYTEPETPEEAPDDIPPEDGPEEDFLGEDFQPVDLPEER